MNRPTEPEKKAELLDRCLAAAIDSGALDASLNAIAQQIGSSGRMLVYHFGSKQELERQIISRLEVRLRQNLESSLAGMSDETLDLLPPLLQLWQQFTSPEMQGLLKLTMALNQRAAQGDRETQQFLEQESQHWVEALSRLTQDAGTALLLFHLFQGAIVDFLTTGNAQRGRQTIEALAKTLISSGVSAQQSGSPE